MVRKLRDVGSMRATRQMRVLAVMLIVGCGRADSAPAQADTTVNRLATDGPTRAAATALAAHEPWRAKRILDSAFADPSRRPPNAILLGTLVDAALGDW